MKRWVPITLLAFGLMWTGIMGCGTSVCDEAANVYANCPGAPQATAEDKETPPDEEPTGGESIDCSDGSVAACTAQCVLDNPQAACESIKPDPNLDVVADLTDCIADC